MFIWCEWKCFSPQKKKKKNIFYLHILPLFVYSTNSSYLHSLFFLALFIKVCMHDVCWKKRKNQHTHECTCIHGNKNVKKREYFQCTFKVRYCCLFFMHFAIFKRLINKGLLYLSTGKLICLTLKMLNNYCWR
jgi:hypothetical protein